MLNFSKQIIAFSIILFFVLAPTFLTAQTPPPGQYDVNNTGIVQGCQGSSCDFTQFIQAIQKVTRWAVTFALAFSVVVIAWAGWLYLTSGGDSGKVSKAHEMFGSIAWGIGWVLAAWFIVELIVRTLVKPSAVTTIISN